MSHAFSQVNVFSTGPLGGNPVAVVHGADDLTDAQMGAFARWTNLSETTFLLAPTDPPPTIDCGSSPLKGNCRSPVTPRWAPRTLGWRPEVSQLAPTWCRSVVWAWSESRRRAACEWIVNGTHWIGVLLRDADAVLAVRPVVAAMEGLSIGVVGPHPEGSECAVEVRTLFGTVEDPVTIHSQGTLLAG